MIITKNIKRAYDRCASTYDTHTNFQQHLAAMLAKAVKEDDLEFSYALDIGCGTGYLMHEIKKAIIFGCDISFGMLNRAKEKLKAASYVQADALRLPFDSFSFDLVVSNAAYQWIFDLRNAFREVRRILKSNGRFYFTIFNRNTLWQLREVCRKIGIKSASNNFVNKDVLSDILREVGFGDIKLEMFGCKKYYKNLWELLQALKNMGATVAENKNVSGLGWRKILRRVNDLYFAKFSTNEGLSATYEAFLVMAVKNEQNIIYNRD